MGTVRQSVVAALLLFFSHALRADAIDDYVTSQMRSLHLPGVAVVVVRDGVPSTVRAYGMANLEHGVPVTPETMFEIGSVTKQFTSFAVMMLVEEGKVRLDDTIDVYLPDVPRDWRGITVRHLLTHASGIEEYLSVPGLDAEAHAKTHDDMTNLFFRRLKLDFAPGATWSYSNSGYLLLGNLIERVTGKSYWTFLSERIFQPLEMSSTRSSEPRAVIPRRASGYRWVDGRYENRAALSENAFAAGSILSTIRDMARWEAALHARKLLSASSYEQMWTPQMTSSGELPPVNYGFGWFVEKRHGRRVVLHAGGTPGFSSVIRRYADAGVSVIVLANHGDRVIDQLAVDIAGIFARELAWNRSPVDPDPELTARLRSALCDLIAGTAAPGNFTPAMQTFLKTATGRGVWEWVASDGELKSLAYAGSEEAGNAMLVRYRAVFGEADLALTFTVSREGKIAQVVWW